jgi:hypothetical protein
VGGTYAQLFESSSLLALKVVDLDFVLQNFCRPTMCLFCFVSAVQANPKAEHVS